MVTRLPLLIVVVVVVVLVVIAGSGPSGRLRQWSGSADDRLHGARFHMEPLLVNQAERSAWEFLQHAGLGQQHIFAKVRLEDVVSAHAADGRTWNAARSRIKSSHVDFLLTDQDFRPILAVEVDGASHRGERAAERDAMKDRIFAMADLPLLRLKVGANWQATVADWRREQAEKPLAQTSREGPNARSRR